MAKVVSKLEFLTEMIMTKLFSLIMIAFFIFAEAFTFAKEVQAENKDISEKISLRIFRGRPYIKARIDKSPEYYFLFDTGGGFGLDEHWLKKLNIRSVREKTLIGIGGEIQVAQEIQDLELNFGSLILKNVKGFATNFSNFSNQDIDGIPIVGMIGTELFSRNPILIDNEEGNIYLYPEESTAPISGMITKLEKNGSGNIFIKGVANDAKTTYLLDTGSDAGFTFLGPNLPQKIDEKAPLVLTGAIGGYTSGAVQKVDKIEVFGDDFGSPISILTLTNKGLYTKSQGNFSLLGYRVLRNYNVYIDLKKNNYNAPNL